MKSKKPLNPFPTTGYFGPEYFCDREEESLKISQFLKNGQSCILMGNRRLGKTALIHHVKGFLPKDWIFLYLDILPTGSEREFLDTFGSALLRSFNEKSKLGRNVWEFIKSLQPTISFDQLSGLPQVSFLSVNTQKPIEDILLFLSKLDYNTVIAIDEFQQITQYPEKNTDAWLRSIIQQLQNVYFIFSGSQQSILNELFSSPSRPFFRSATPIKIEKIHHPEYKEFIIRHFSLAGKSISGQMVDEVLEWTKCYTYYVQMLCNRLYQLPNRQYFKEDWLKCAKDILKEQEAFFIHYRTLLSPQQWKLLVAIAKTGEVTAPTSKDFIGKNNLGNPSTVFKSLDALRDKEMIIKAYDKDGNTTYEVYDVFFERWIQGLY